MEEVDYILIQQLRDIGCELDDNINGIKDLEVEQIMAIVCQCVALISDSNNIDLKNELPANVVNESMNMSLKYKTATQLAQICSQDLCYKSEVGYQTFLYGNENDVRKLFLFLLEKLSKDSDRIESIGTNGLAEKSLLNVIKRSRVSTTWLPIITDSGRQLWSTTGLVNTKQINVKSILLNKVAPNRRKYYDNCLKLPDSLSAIIEWNYLLLNSDSSDNQMNKSKKVKIESKEESHKTIDRIDIIEAPILSLINKNIEITDDLSQRNEDISGERIKSKDDNNYQNLIQDLNKQLKQLEEEIGSKKCVFDKYKQYEDSYKEQVKSLRKLESNEKTEFELKSEINKVKEDIKEMNEKWQQIQNQLSNNLSKVKFESQAKNERSVNQQKYLIDLKKSISVKNKEIKSKELQIEELIEKLPQQWPPTRVSYTKRILEIISNVKKQNEETKKVLLETRSLQKEINNLSGKLSRTFTVADEVVFKDAKINEWNRKCYKLLASMHEHCDQLLEAVSNIGLILREIRQLEESVETERSRKTSSNLSRILADLDQIKLENQKLDK